MVELLTHLAWSDRGYIAATCKHHLWGQGVAPQECGSASSSMSPCCHSTCWAHREIPEESPGKSYCGGWGGSCSHHHGTYHCKSQKSAVQVQTLRHLCSLRGTTITLRFAQCKGISFRGFCIKICSALTRARELKPRPCFPVSWEH